MTCSMRMNSTVFIGFSDAIQKLNLDLTELEHLPSSNVEENQSVDNSFTIPIGPIYIQNSSFNQPKAHLKMNKTIELEDINWEVTHIFAKINLKCITKILKIKKESLARNNITDICNGISRH